MIGHRKIDGMMDGWIKRTKDGGTDGKIVKWINRYMIKMDN